MISILLVSTLLVGLLGTFFISKVTTSRARHRMAAMNILKEYIEREVAADYDGGSDGESDYYVTVISAAPVAVTIDDRSTPDDSDNLVGAIVADPYYPDNTENEDGSPISYDGVPYKIIGFIVTWNEDLTNQACSESAHTYLSYHSST